MACVEAQQLLSCFKVFDPQRTGALAAFETQQVHSPQVFESLTSCGPQEDKALAHSFPMQSLFDLRCSQSTDHCHDPALQWCFGRQVWLTNGRELEPDWLLNVEQWVCFCL